ncbi:unnamed protein product [Pseudo-nitzschia multistriata]|uniref:NmrA-like domain-containing protein n=1 Tax=Pseudo-nitzschia multistriata TaxID=183589 RepID=A0A448ZC95_9STRA|nr:unnamed protein product [Pseudo-nitzschia multistriata]
MSSSETTTDKTEPQRTKKTAVVIGATGYIGSAVTMALGDHGMSVRCTSRDASGARWLKDLASDVSVVELALSDTAGEDTAKSLRSLLRGADMAFFCAGFEEQSPSTIDFMVSNALALVDASRAEGVPVVVLTSSGGSTNPPGGLPSSVPKSEVLHFSDPEEQVLRGRYSPAAKTRMEARAFAAVGRNHANEVVDPVLAGDPATPRLVVINPNLVLGPQLDPSPTVKGNSLPWMARILRKEAMADAVPNDSMSIIDVRDLAELHVAAALDEAASGRYFGVNRSYAWREILGAFQRVLAERGGRGYSPPPLKEGEDYDSAIPTQFDHTRKNSLGVTLRPLEETLGDLVDFLRAKGAI